MTATEGEIDLYTSGACHVFAVALHRLLGAEILVVTDPADPAWVDDADPDNQIDGVVHAFAVLDGMALDVEGSRPADTVEEYCRERFGTFLPNADHVFDEEGLSMYVEGQPDDDEEGIDRPLSAYTEEDVAAALDVAARLHGSPPGPKP